MARKMRFNPPPGWPPMPEGWLPPDDWDPPESYPPAPAGWKFVVAERRHFSAKRLALFTTAIVVLLAVVGVSAAALSRNSASPDEILHPPGRSLPTDVIDIANTCPKSDKLENRAPSCPQATIKRAAKICRNSGEAIGRPYDGESPRHVRRARNGNSDIFTFNCAWDDSVPSNNELYIRYLVVIGGKQLPYRQPIGDCVGPHHCKTFDHGVIEDILGDFGSSNFLTTENLSIFTNTNLPGVTVTTDDWNSMLAAFGVTADVQDVLDGAPYVPSVGASTAPRDAPSTDAAESPTSTAAPDSGDTCNAVYAWDVRAGPTTTCDFAEAVADAYSNSGDLESRSITTTDPQDGQSYTMHCTVTTLEPSSRITCTGGQPTRTVYLKSTPPSDWDSNADTSSDPGLVPSATSTTPNTGETDCGADDHWNIVAGASTSCDFAAAVSNAYSASESASGTVTVTDPEDGQSHKMHCVPVTNESETYGTKVTITCTGGDPLRTVRLG